MFNKQVENMSESKGCANKSKVKSRKKALKRFNIKIVERNIKLLQQKPVQTISFLFCFCIRAFIKSEKKLNIPSAIHKMKTSDLEEGKCPSK